MKYFSLILIATFLGSCAQNAEPEIHYIPESLVGSIICIRFDQEVEEPKDYNKGKRVYRISDNGRLNSKFSQNSGWIPDKDHFEFFLVDSVGTVTGKLPWNYLASLDFYEKHAGELGVMSFYNASSEFDFLSYVVDTVDLDMFLRKNYNDRQVQLEGVYD